MPPAFLPSSLPMSLSEVLSGLNVPFLQSSLHLILSAKEHTISKKFFPPVRLCMTQV